MQSFRTELENPVVEKDIIELEQKILKFRKGEIDEDQFRSLRLARGVYGQRQPGVQMIRIKIPYGKLTTTQLRRISDVSDEYSTGKLHVTTRQDIQIHYVSLDRTPQLWEELEKDNITLREACGNSVRNITASALAGVDLLEPFDVSPYAKATFEYFLRNPIGQELGRKIKIAFSSSEKDTAYTFIHDLGFIPKIKNNEGKEERGFKVVIGGGLGSTPILAQTVYEFLPEDEIIPFSEAALRVFDREGERNNRNKARLKYLLKSIGLESFLALVNKERLALKNKRYPIDSSEVNSYVAKPIVNVPEVAFLPEKKFNRWKNSNVIKQKQDGFFTIKIKLQTGDFTTKTARLLADLVDAYAADDIRLTIGQGIVLKYVRPEYLPYLFVQLDKLNLADPGSESTADITACPGTDTCNLGISNSTGITKELERVINTQYPELIYNGDIKIKISGCMNSCGQHALANIGFHGSTLKSGKLVAPAMQVLLGGGVVGNGAGRVADKVLKIPSKRAPLALTTVLDDYDTFKLDNELFNTYYNRKGKIYFYHLLKEIANTEQLTADEYVDWGKTGEFKMNVGVGECAGVTVDLVSTLLLEAEEKLEKASEALDLLAYADSIYHSYTAFINGAKSILTAKQVKSNTQRSIINLFDEHFVNTGEIKLNGSFEDLVLEINKKEPSSVFAQSYLEQAQNLYRAIVELRKEQVEDEK